VSIGWGTGRRALAPDPHRVRAFPGSAAALSAGRLVLVSRHTGPVIGLVQVGDQALADRYTYVPFIGLFLLVTWGTAEMAQAWHVPRVVVSAVATGLLLVCTGLTWRQLTHWENGLELWKQAASVSDQSSFAHYYLAVQMAQRGMRKDGLKECQTAVRLDPGYAPGHNLLGVLLRQQLQTAEAEAEFRTAAKLDATYGLPHTNLVCY